MACAILPDMAKRKRLPPDVRELFRAWGRQGGKEGGAKRMAALTPEERTKLARKAARARWRKRNGGASP
jgi:hypothetical protein